MRIGEPAQLDCHPNAPRPPSRMTFERLFLGNLDGHSSAHKSHLWSSPFPFPPSSQPRPATPLLSSSLGFPHTLPSCVILFYQRIQSISSFTRKEHCDILHSIFASGPALRRNANLLPTSSFLPPIFSDRQHHSLLSLAATCLSAQPESPSSTRRSSRFSANYPPPWVVHPSFCICLQSLAYLLNHFLRSRKP